jgi:crotonobetainyl-CoA:carnitine CoA-transferase CaiB-like acyl-CoA transferase
MTFAPLSGVSVVDLTGNVTGPAAEIIAALEAW